ncbi:hypothetical protein ACIBFB_07225 [Nocardiopsis sp. NPDC050513]|uniref:hypothetical protein n=1 Tax=Nocardiopsis sp. NPDC050513 TaxID=3364338 RepID=UPI00378ED8ED
MDLASLGQLGSALWAMISSSPIYLNLLGGAAVGVFWKSYLDTAMAKNDLQGHEIHAFNDEQAREARRQKAKNTPAYLRVADLDNIYVQRVSRVATTIRTAVENIGQHLTNLWSIPFHRKAITGYLAKKEGQDRVQDFRDRESVAARHGVALKGQLTAASGGAENRRSKLS